MTKTRTEREKAEILQSPLKIQKTAATRTFWTIKSI